MRLNAVSLSFVKFVFVRLFMVSFFLPVACYAGNKEGTSGTGVAEEFVDLIELNHFYDCLCRPVYDQVIFWENDPVTGKFQVRAWCLVEDRDVRNRRPVKNLDTDLYQVDWFDAEKRISRKVSSKLYRESWTQVDPERQNKRVLPENDRLFLIQTPPKNCDTAKNEEERRLLEQEQREAEEMFRRFLNLPCEKPAK